MSDLRTRVITYVFGVPAVFALILLLPYYNHLALHAVLILCCILGGYEMQKMTASRGMPSLKAAPYLSAALPLTVYLISLDLIPNNIYLLALAVVISFIFIREIFRTEDEAIESIIPRISSTLLIIAFPGFFFAFLPLITTLPNSGFTFSAFVLLIFVNDTFAYLAGSLFGKNSRGISKISPNKSIHGFLGGFVFTILFSVLVHLIFPDIFGSYFLAVIIGIVLGILGIIGDLVESALKRSSDQKDSGTIIPGRGGILDSTDSIFFSAPFFYFLMIWLR